MLKETVKSRKVMQACLLMNKIREEALTFASDAGSYYTKII